MKAIVCMFDSLNRRFLPPYGCDWVVAPNFQRLAKRTVTFENSYVCSMPCMPARRDFHTARPDFLHRGWGPMEPFDDSVPQMLGKAGVYTHLCSDHYHYWEENAANYHTKYNSWEFFRGMEIDPCVGQAADPLWPEAIGKLAGRNTHTRRHLKFRQSVKTEADFPIAKTFSSGLEFLRRNKDEDRWMLHLETFAPHEPFFTPRHYKDLYPHDYSGPLFDWPPYRGVQETEAAVQHVRYEYAADVSMCDRYLGDLLDLMDKLDMWKETLLVVWTDHGYLLGEHDHWGKSRTPWYQELAHTPFFVWDPRCGKAGERRKALVQPSIDLGPTLLNFFGLAPTERMLGHDLRETIATDAPAREAGIFGQFGPGQVNVTDGRYVYMRAGVQPPDIFEYTLLPAIPQMTAEGGVTLAEPQPWSNGFPVLKTPIRRFRLVAEDITPVLTEEAEHHLLWDVQADPLQQTPLEDPAIEARMIALLKREMERAQAPKEQFVRLGLV